MPEGPEVKLTTDWLNTNYNQCTITLIEFSSGNEKFKKQLKPLVDILPITITMFGCKGKFSYWKIKNIFDTNEQVLFISFMLTGAFLDRNPTTLHVHYGDTKKLPATDHIKFFGTRQNGSDFEFYFNDSRQFGKFELKTLNDLDTKLNELGPDILNIGTDSNESDFDKFYQAASGKKIPIVNTILDQKIIAGVGNYLRAEALYIANIDPFQSSCKLTKDEFKKLFYTIKNVAKIFYEKGKNENKIISESEKKLNLRVSDLIDLGNGKIEQSQKGRFTRTELIKLYSDHRFLVYQQKQTPNGETVSVKKLNNRSIYYVNTKN